MKHKHLKLNVLLLMGMSLGFSTLQGQTTMNVKTTDTNIQNVLIPAGTFIMGSPATEETRLADEDQFQVTLSAFRMSKYEITNAQFAAFLNAKSIGSDGLYAAGSYPAQALIHRNGSMGITYTESKWVPATGYENSPVIFVTWYGASEFATYAGGKLPTEAQWEYACRAGSTTTCNTGNCLTNLQANYWWDIPYSTCNNPGIPALRNTQPVGSHPPNTFGLYDMHGNVFEWCADWYGLYPSTPQTNPTGATSSPGRVYRGGSWSFIAKFCRSAYRCGSLPENYENYLGFRVVFAP
jgi:formylglycine-generating enzyme